MVDQYNKRRTDKMRAICAQHGIPLAQQIAGTQLADVRFDGIVVRCPNLLRQPNPCG